MASYSKGLYVFKYLAEFQTDQFVTLPNDDVAKKPVTVFKRHAALHNAKASYLETLDGFNRTTDIVIAIHAVRNDVIQTNMDYQLYTVIFKGVSYVIRQIDPDDSNDLDGYHLIFLRKKDYANWFFYRRYGWTISKNR